jgi:acetyl-CoA synthetase
MNEEIYQEFAARTGLTPLTGYGQTETSLQIANFEAETSRLASMGRPSPMYDIFLLAEDGREAADNEEGEIVIRPSKDGRIPGVFTGYLNNDELYKKVWSGGVYHTGDSAYRDEAGLYWFKGRLDDVIKTGGYRVGPYEIEEVLLRHPAVYECRIIGVPDEQRGQAIKAAIVLDSGFTASRKLDRELKEFVNSRLSEYKWLRIIEFVTSLPKTISGKIIRKKSN